MLSNHEAAKRLSRNSEHRERSPKGCTNLAEGNALGPTMPTLLALKGQTSPHQLHKTM